MTEPITWMPDKRTLVVWQIAGTAIFFISLLVFAYIAVGESDVAVTIGDIAVAVVLTVLVLIAHEAIHAVAMRAFGARPRFGAKMMGRSLPALYCTSPGYRFSRPQFVVVALAPLVVITLAGLWVLTRTDWAGRSVFALATNASGAIGDLWINWLVLRAAPGTEIEDLEDGIRLHPKR